MYDPIKRPLQASRKTECTNVELVLMWATDRYLTWIMVNLNPNTMPPVELMNSQMQH